MSASKCVYNSLTYIDVIEPQETVRIQDMSVVGIAIHNFIDTRECVARRRLRCGAWRAALRDAQPRDDRAPMHVRR